MKNSVYKRHINNYLKHWWFQARKNIIQEVIKKTFNKNLIILDFGSGSGVNVEMLSKFGLVNIYEPHLKTRKYLKVKYKNKIKFKILNKVGAKKFDLIILADVLEHIKKDKNQIKMLEKNLNKNDATGTNDTPLGWARGPHWRVLLGRVSWFFVWISDDVWVWVGKSRILVKVLDLGLGLLGEPRERYGRNDSSKSGRTSLQN